MSDFPRWSDEEITEGCAAALEAYVSDWRVATNAAFVATAEERRDTVERLFANTGDLRAFEPETFLRDWPLLAALRFCWSPPVSQDVLANLSGRKFTDRPPKPTPEAAEGLRMAIVDVLRVGLDPVRFPWLQAEREPEGCEREAAVKSTAVLMAVETVRTGRRLDPARRQQEAVAAVLRDECGYVGVERPRGGIRLIDDLARGTFTAETSLRGEKADVPVRLRDGRLLAIECKVTNDRTNSVKRIKHDTGKKAAKWRRDLGEEQVVVGAVVSGVVAPETIRSSQNDDKVFIVWQHDLSRLRDFVLSVDPS